MKRRWVRSPLLWGFLFSSLQVLAVLAVLPVRFETNDDLGLISSIIRAGDESTPTYYISENLRWMLSLAYEAVPGVPWYGISMYLGLWVSMGLIFGLLIKWGHRHRGTCCIWPLLLVLCLRMLMFLNFSTVMLMLLFSVLLCLLDWGVNGVPSGRSRWVWAGTLLLLTAWGYLIRPAVAVRVMGFGLPLLMFVRPRSLLLILPWLMPLVLLAAWEHHVHADLVARSQEKQIEQRRFRALRGDFQDSLKGSHFGKSTEAALQAAGWEEDDYALYHMWVMYDEVLFNTHTLWAFLKANNPPEDKNSRVMQRFVYGYERNSTNVHLFLAGLLVVAILAGPCLRRENAGTWLRMGFGLGIVAGGVLYLMYFRFVARVYTPVMVYILAMGACFLGRLRQEVGPPTGRARTAHLVLLALVTGLLIWKSGERLDSYIDRLRSSYMDKIHVLGSLEPVAERGDDPYLMLLQPGIGLKMGGLHPLKEWDEVPDIRVLTTGTGINTPVYFQLLSDLGLSGGRELMAWTVDNGRVLFPLFAMGRGHSQYITGLWESYMNRRIAPGRRIRLVPVYDYRNPNGWGMVYYAMRSGRG